MSDNFNNNNMNRIRLISTNPVKYNARNNKKAKVVLELDWKANANRTGYVATITDYKREYIDIQVSPGDEDNPPVYETRAIDTRIPGKQEPVLMSNAEASLLFDTIKPLIPTGLSYAEEEIQKLRLCFHMYVNQDFVEDENGELIPGVTIYDLPSGEWLILRE